MPEIQGHQVTITALPNPRHFEYQIDTEKIQEIEVGSAEEALLAVSRILSDRHDPSKAPADKPKPPLGAKPESKPEEKPELRKGVPPSEQPHKGVTSDGKPSTI